MKVRDLILKLNSSGPFDVILKDNFFASNDGYGEKGMKATVLKLSKDGLVFDYSKFTNYNRNFESPDYEGGQTATQAEKVVAHEIIYLIEERDKLIDVCELIDSEEPNLFQEFLESGESHYVAYLENLVKTLRFKTLTKL